jgi:deaminated glutathione amidase
MGAVWQAGGVSSLALALHQAASSLDPAENRAALDAIDDEAADLVVFPEVFMRDFGTPGSDLGAHAEPLDGPFVSRLNEVATERGTTIVAGMFEVSDDPGRPYNTLVVVDPSGLRATYRKIHLYDSFGYRESDRLLAGPLEPVLVDLGGFTVGLMTCYDLRFPELARSLVERGADLLVVPSAWVAGPGKLEHWRTLVTARAIENTAYVVAVGQPGPRYTGHSLVVAPDGTVVVQAGEGEQVLTAVLERDAVEQARATNPSLANRRM